MAKVQLFAVFIEDFEKNLLALEPSLQITETFHCMVGTTMTIEGPRESIENFLRKDFCVGMEEQDAIDMFESIED